MRAIKLQTHIGKDHTLSVKLPEDMAEGPAEIIVLVQEPAKRAGHSLADFLRTLSEQPRSTRSKEEIDRDLERERESWD
jgi:hypothetical protein